MTYHYIDPSEPQRPYPLLGVWLGDYFAKLDEVSVDAQLIFPSGSSVLTCGDKIVARIPAPITMTVAEWQAAQMDDRLQLEPQRAPLPNSDAWRYTGKERDGFPGFTVNSSEAIDFILPANRPAPKGSTLHAHPGKGSALLLG